MEDEIRLNLEEVRRRMAVACVRVGRAPEEVELIAVSKTFPVECLREALAAGQRVFGESRQQEAQPKMEALPSSVCWHFIGRVQRNKVRKLVGVFDMLHAVDSLRLAAYIDGVAEEFGVFPKLFLQVNVGGEESKGGFEPEVLRSELEGVLRLKRLEVCGLMCIPPVEREAEASRKWFVALRELRDELERSFGVPLRGLSMGMSGDYEVAIEEGATHVRVGSAIFGRRAYRVDGELG
jgi:PLP dependent protein